MTTSRKNFAETIFTRKMLVVLLLGFSSGLPLLAIGSTLQAWLNDARVDLGTIGLLTSLVGAPYTVKFLWSPVFDLVSLPFLGRRRGWILVSQLCVALTIILLGQSDPHEAIWTTAFLAFLVAFSSATLDTVSDGFRRELLTDNELGLGSALFINGYRLGMLVSGALALRLSDIGLSWSQVYLVVAGSMVLGMAATLLAEEEAVPRINSKSLSEAILVPFAELLRREKAWIIVAFVLLYKIGDTLASSLTTPFLLEIGFSKTQIAYNVKVFGLASLIIGGLVGGGLMLRIGINRALWFFGVFQALSILPFAFIAQAGPNEPLLVAAVIAENLSFGMGTSAYSAFMARCCDRRFSATQYALLTSLMGMVRVYAAAPAGYLAEFLGWESFFLSCSALALPGLVLLFWAAPFNGENKTFGVKQVAG